MNSSLLVALASLIFLSAANTIVFVDARSWEQIIRQEFDIFNLKYHDENVFLTGHDEQQEQQEDTESFKSFATNFERIQIFNNEAQQKNQSARLAVNKFAKMKYDEFAKMFTGLIPESEVSTLKNAARSLSLHSRIKKRKFKKQTKKPSKTNGQPKAIDWREKNVVTPVKYQGICGSCWAFSAVSALESHYAIKSGKLYELSEQQLVDCSSNQRYGNKGCNGGLMSWAYDYIMVKGIEERSSYKYTAKQESCKYSSTKALIHIETYEYIYGEAQMAKIVGNVGPITVAIYASPNFQSYASGILDDPLCNSKSRINHAVVIVGYGRENGQDYWIIKNSWGTDWGENGYARMLKGVNMCKIESEVTYPII